MKFNPVTTVVILALCAIIVNIYTLAIYLLALSSEWLSDAGVVLPIVTIAVYFGIEDDD